MTPASNPLLNYGDALGREWKEKDFFLSSPADKPFHLDCIASEKNI